MQSLSVTTPSVDVVVLPELHVPYTEAHWYAAYTCPRHEKRVAEQMAARAMEVFLPLYETVRRWSDRRKRIALPLFPGYVFARIALRDRLRVLEVPGVVRLVGFNGRPVPLPDGEVEALRNGLGLGLRAEPHRYLTAGCRVRIRSGPLAGLEGILVRRKGALRVVVSIELIRRAVALELDASALEPLPPRLRSVAQPAVP